MYIDLLKRDLHPVNRPLLRDFDTSIHFKLTSKTLIEVSLTANLDRVAQHLEIISKIFQFSTRRTRIGNHHAFLGTNRKSYGQNSGLLKKF